MLSTLLLGLEVFVALLLFALIFACIHFREYQWRRMCGSRTKLTGKTVIITGGNAGIGKQAAIDLARRGASVIIGCRNPQKAEAAVNDIRQFSGNFKVYYRPLDLSSMSSVRAFAESFVQEHERLDILINNAGIVSGKPGERTSEGHDIVFGTNNFGHFLLTMLLLDVLKASDQSRVVNVTSRIHKLATNLDMTPLRDEQGRTVYPKLSGYACSKLGNILLTKELARRLQDTSVTSFSVSPGGVYTSLFQSGSNATYSLRDLLFQLLVRPVFWLVLMSEKVGAQTSIYCAVEESITKHSGGYFSNCQLATNESDLAKDEGLAKKLWEISCDVTAVSIT
ncbi:retinol dehydrogenase 11-like [Amphiura filiformis]|uniref:retinol dehydrogenase 11-like n=1 Tax=Amphiura filiformis TaxID=82378 RepID=UPI003B212E4A